MENLDLILLISRWAHISAAIIAVGGAAFLRFVLHPAARNALDDEQHQVLREAVRRRWSLVLFACIGVLFVTGGANFVILAFPPKIEPMPYHAIFGLKFLVALTIFFIGSALAGRSAGLAKMRENSAKWLGVLLVLAALVILLSGTLAQVRMSSVP